MNHKIIVLQGSFPGGTPHRSVIKLSASNNYLLQRKTSFNQNNLSIQKTSSGNAFQIDQRRLNLSGSGNPLPNDVRQKMESVFNIDFSGVKIHTGGYQAESIGALAFTTGNDIYFAQGQYNPHSQYGQRILGHELTHVVQQRNGRVKNPFGNGIAVVNDHGMEAEAERMGIKAVSTGNNRLIQNKILPHKNINDKTLKDALQMYISPTNRWPLNLFSAAVGPATGARGAFWDSTEWFMYRGPGSIRKNPNELLGDRPYYLCMECGRFYPQEGVNIDHINPWNVIRVGAANRADEINRYNDIRNLQLLCTSCNLAKLANPAWHYGGEYRAGLIDSHLVVTNSPLETMGMMLDTVHYRNPHPPVHF